MPRIEHAMTLPERVADQLRRRIASGEFPIGSLLPTELELTRELGVSRSSVREALRSLVHAGLLGARAGYGTFVRATSDVAPTLARRIEQERSADVGEVRALLEREGARLAARRITAEQMRRLRDALEARSVVSDGPAYAAADVVFHQVLLEASGNALLAELYRGVGGNERALVHLDDPNLDFQAMRADLTDIDNAHARIVDAVAARDEFAAADAASEAVQLAHRHLTDTDGHTNNQEGK